MQGSKMLQQSLPWGSPPNRLGFVRSWCAELALFWLASPSLLAFPFPACRPPSPLRFQLSCGSRGVFCSVATVHGPPSPLSSRTRLCSVCI